MIWVYLPQLLWEVFNKGFIVSFNSNFFLQYIVHNSFILSCYPKSYILLKFRKTDFLFIKTSEILFEGVRVAAILIHEVEIEVVSWLKDFVLNCKKTFLFVSMNLFTFTLRSENLQSAQRLTVLYTRCFTKNEFEEL